MFIKDKAQKVSAKLFGECDGIVEDISGESEWREGKDFAADGDVIVLT